MRRRVAAGGLRRGKVHRLFNEMPSVKSRFFAVCCLFAGLLSCAGAYAALPAASRPAAKPAASAPAVSVADKLSEAQQALDQLETIKLDKLPAGVTPGELLFRRALLERLVASYAWQLDLAGERDQRLRQQAEAEEALRSWSGFAQAGPYPVSLVEGLRSRLQTGGWEKDTQQAQQLMLSQMQEAMRNSLKLNEVSLRQAREQLEGAAAGEAEALRWRMDGARWRRDISASELLQFDALGQVLRIRQQTLQAQLDLWRKQLDGVGKQVRFQPAELDGVQRRLGEERLRLEREMSAHEQRRRRVKAELEELERQLAALKQKKDAPAQAALLQDLTQRTVEQRQALDNSDLAVQLMRIRQEANSQEGGIWEYRYQLYAGKAANLAEVASASRQAGEELGAVRDYLQKEAELTMAKMADVQHEVGLDRGGGHALAMLQLLRQRLDIVNAAQQPVQAALTGILLLQQEFDVGAPAEGTPQEVSRRLSERVLQAARALWNYELFSADDSVEINGQKVQATRSVTIGKSLGAILVLLIGYAASTALLRALRRLATHRLGFSEAAANIWWRWSYVCVIALLVVFALNLVKIPLTVFAFLGGALAIGIGFGTQNLLKNLISGVMLLVERPLKVGDFVQVGGISGTVSSIGLRSSVVRAGDGIETLIPNSTFVESAVTNWTYSNRRIRRKIAIGVAYGSPPREVCNLLLAEAERHGLVLKEPPPRVLFSNFGADALEFELEYWLDIGDADSVLVASDLRHMIDGALAKAGIELPFPQRDVHLQQGEPLQIEVRRAAGGRASDSF
ncbi:mechanosensitive ion channel domain-containing protein [Chromobacterium sp. Panama]|uniref:mechanosensitive ion channel domain-containing protein n=1 Tax=Chromobacterium sp. Panama TaxID=2161826 RepID=UPI0011B21622|nr:mechanosensitive ion channel domain-containing protein [Chromobacterium sp. Panama]